MSIVDVVMRVRRDWQTAGRRGPDIHMHPDDWRELARDADSLASTRTVTTPSLLGQLAGDTRIFAATVIEPGEFVLSEPNSLTAVHRHIWRCVAHDDCREHPRLGRECALDNRGATQDEARPSEAKK